MDTSSYGYFKKETGMVFFSFFLLLFELVPPFPHNIHFLADEQVM